MDDNEINYKEIVFPGGYSPYATRGDCYFDEQAAQKALRFIQLVIVYVDGDERGQPLPLEQWQKDIILTLYGWKRPDGTRRYREVYIEIPRKQGKSTLTAAIGLYELFCGSPGTRVFSAAAKRDQAALVYQYAKDFIEFNPALKKLCKPYATSKTITVDRRGSYYKVLSGVDKGQHGEKPSCILFDELHEQATPDLWKTLTSGFLATKEPLLISLTTAGHDKTTICWQRHEYAQKVIEGVLEDNAFLPIIYAADQEDDWKDRKTWYKANPNLGVSAKLENLEREFLLACELVSEENKFRRLYLNQWTEAETRWITDDKWTACQPEEFEDLRGKPCFAGLDLASTCDLAALSLVFPLDGGRYAVLPYFWIPEITAVKRSRRDLVQYAEWIKQGFIEATPGDVTDYDIIRARIIELNTKYQIKKIAVDRWNSTQLSTQLTGEGFDLVAFGQGYASMSSPTKELEKLVLSGRLIHDGNPVLRWNMANVCIEQDAAGNMKPSKAKSREKIDGAVALIMGLGVAINEPIETPSVYEERGVYVF